MIRRVLITGSRDWSDRTAVWSALNQELQQFQRLTLVHGAARGADTIAADWALGMAQSGYEVKIESYPAEWDKYGKRAGVLRNKQMVDLGADVCHAFPMNTSIGTFHCMNIAHVAGIPVINHGWTP